MALSPLLKLILEKFVDDYGPAVLRAEMERAIPRIVAGMEAKQMTLAFAEAPLVIRDALFRLWRSVIRSGDIADLVRDHMDDKVIRIVQPELDPDAETEEVVRATLDGLLEVTF